MYKSIMNVPTYIPIVEHLFGENMLIPESLRLTMHEPTRDKWVFMNSKCTFGAFDEVESRAFLVGYFAAARFNAKEV